MPIESNLSDSLDELSRTSSSAGVARVKRGRNRKGANKESAESLLDSILDDSSKAAEEEQRKQDEARKLAEEEEMLRKEREEVQKRIDGEMLLLKEQKAHEELRKNQSQMIQKVEREKAIEAGLIDVEEEERLAREAEAKKRAAEEEKERKAREKKERRERIAAQKAELESLKHAEQLEAAKPKPSNAPKIVAVAAVAAIIIGVVAFFMLNKKEIDIYALSEPSTRSIGFLQEDLETQPMIISIVAQEAPKAPPKASSKKTKRPAGNAPSTTAAPSKPSLRGKGGGLTSRKGGLGSGKL